MALKTENILPPGRFTPANANYPYGSYKDRTFEGALDGSPVIAVSRNDQLGFSDALLAEAGIAPSGSPDTALNSDRLTAIKKIISKLAVRRHDTVAAMVADTTANIGDIFVCDDRPEIYFKALTGLNVNTHNIIQSTGVPSITYQILFDSKYQEDKGLGFGRSFMQQLNADEKDVNLLVQGDSTGNETFEWVYQTVLFLATLFPRYTVNYYLWNSTAYNPADVIQVGTGSFNLNIYNGSVSGSSTYYFRGDKKTAGYAGKNFDLIILSYGHNHGASSSDMILRGLMLDKLGDMRNDQPTAEIAVTLQNIDTSLAEFSARQTEANIYAAGHFGCSIIDIRSVFEWKETVGTLGEWMLDSVHPNAIGSLVWSRIVVDGLLNSKKQNYSTSNPFLQHAKQIARNCDFTHWDTSTLLPRLWIGGGLTTLTRDFTIFETGRFSLNAKATTGAISAVVFENDDFLNNRSPGVGVTFSARVYFPASTVSNWIGDIEINLGTSIPRIGGPSITECRDGWVWVSVHATGAEMDAATQCTPGIFCGNNSDVDGIYIDRVSFHEGSTPRTLELPYYNHPPEFFYEDDVIFFGTDAGSVTGQNITLSSSGEAYPTAIFRCDGLEPGEMYTATWDLGAVTNGNVNIRDFAVSGPIIKTATFSAGIIRFYAIDTKVAVQFTANINNATTVPFTAADCKLQKGSVTI